MKKLIYFVYIIFACLVFLSCFSINTPPILHIESASKNASYTIEMENYINAFIPNKIMSFVFENDLDENVLSHISNIEIIVKDMQNFSKNECIMSYSSEKGTTLLDLKNIKRLKKNFIKITLPKKYLGKYNAVIIAEKSKEIIELRKVCQNNKGGNLDKTLLYLQGTNPIPENDFSISLRPALKYLYPEYNNIYFYLYNMGFDIEHKVHNLAKSIKEQCNPDTRFDIIAESQGVLVTRSMLLQYPELNKRVDKFISLCGPNEGVYIANNNFIADLIKPYLMKSSTKIKDKYFYGQIILALNMLVFELFPELIDMREEGSFIKDLNSKMNKNTADRLYLIGGTFIPRNEPLGDLFARKSSLMFENCELIPDDRRFIYPYMIHPQVMFDKGVALKMHEILTGQFK